MIIPGSNQVLDRATGKLVACDAKTCPTPIDGVNHAPFAAFGGWSGAINAAKDPKAKDAAYAFLSYMSQPEQANVDVTIGTTGFNPYRTSQFATSTLDQGRHERGGGQELPRRHRGQPEQPEHGARPARAAEPALPAGRARHRRRAVPGRRDHAATQAMTEIVTAGTRSPRSSGKDDQQAAYKAYLG